MGLVVQPRGRNSEVMLITVKGGSGGIHNKVACLSLNGKSLAILSISVSTPSGGVFGCSWLICQPGTSNSPLIVVTLSSGGRYL